MDQPSLQPPGRLHYISFAVANLEIVGAFYDPLPHHAAGILSNFGSAGSTWSQA